MLFKTSLYHNRGSKRIREKPKSGNETERSRVMVLAGQVAGSTTTALNVKVGKAACEVIGSAGETQEEDPY